MSKVGFIGLGVMGFPMAGHLKTRGGNDVTVFNRTRKRAEDWVARFGGRLIEYEILRGSSRRKLCPSLGIC